MRGAWLLALVIVGGSMVQAGSSQPARPDPCVFVEVPHQGPSCAVDGGWLVKLRDGDLLFTHGPDPPEPAWLDEVPMAAPQPTVCVADPNNDWHGRVIYAHASDRANRYSTMASTVRGYVHQANGVLREEAGEFGVVADFRMRCIGGVLEVASATLPTAHGSTSFSTIVSDLRAQGFNHARAKYWVWYDGGVGGFCGQGTIRGDDRLTVENANNFGNDFGITYGCTSNTMLHENGHNLGAVQRSAPDQSGGWHCNDGLDVMCYADGGSNSTYNPNVCTDRRHFDCDHDSYFHPSPAPGSYLATRWNLGSRLNRFIEFGDNQVPDTVPPVTLAARSGTAGLNGWWRSNVTITLTATDDRSGVNHTFYRVDGGAWTTYTAPFVVRGEGSHTYDFHSVDKAGNVEAVRQEALRIDTVAPTLVNVEPDRCAYDPAGACTPNALPPGYALGGAAARIVVVSLASDAGGHGNGPVSMLVYAGNGTRLECAAGPAPAGSLSCAWERDALERVSNLLRVVARDEAGNEAERRINVLG